MNLKEIQELVDLIIEKGISEFEFERSGVRIKISRNVGKGFSEALLQASDHLPAATVSRNSASRTPTPAPATQRPSEGGPEKSATLEELYVVRSPMVGTFYSAPAQGADPFVRVGDKVKVGQPLCVIEAMKLMNEIEAEVAGEVLKCYVENGQPVEYGEPLFDVRPSKPGDK